MSPRADAVKAADESHRILPTSTRGRRTRAAIVAAARTAFETLGYADTNVAAITGAAGVGYGSFYVYFASKDEVFAELTEQLQEEVYKASRVAADGLDPAERIEQENRRYFELYRANARMFQLIEEVAQVNPEFARLMMDRRRDYASRVERGILRLQDEGVADKDLNARYAAEALGAMVQRMAYLTSQDSDLEVELVLQTLRRLWTRAIGLPS